LLAARLSATVYFWSAGAQQRHRPHDRQDRTDSSHIHAQNGKGQVEGIAAFVAPGIRLCGCENLQLEAYPLKIAAFNLWSSLASDGDKIDVSCLKGPQWRDLIRARLTQFGPAGLMYELRLVGRQLGLT